MNGQNCLRTNHFNHPAFTVIKTLILDDSVFDRAKIRKMLQSTNLNFSLKEVTTIEEFEVCVNNDRFDVVCLDFDLPDGTGFDALKMLNAVPKTYPTGSLMISGSNCSSTKIGALKLGCGVYIEKCNLTPSNFKSAFFSAIAISDV